MAGLPRDNQKLNGSRSPVKARPAGILAWPQDGGSNDGGVSQ